MMTMRMAVLTGMVAAMACAGRADTPADEGAGVRLPASDAERQALSRREITILRRQMRAREDAAEAAFKNAETAFLVGEYDRAIEEYLAVANEYEDTSYRMRAVLRVGDVYYRQQRYDRAIAFYQRALRVPAEAWWPEDTPEEYARADYMIGVSYFDQDQLNRAFAHFRRFVQRHPESRLVDRAYDFIGRGNMRMERYGQALEAFRMVGTANLRRGVRQTISPGEDLYVRVVDADVGLATRHATLPVVVRTDSGDEEVLELRALGLGSPVFLGTIRTRLGAPRLTRELDEILTAEVLRQLESLPEAAAAMEAEADAVRKTLDALTDPGPRPEEGESEAARQALAAWEEAHREYTQRMKRGQERHESLMAGARRLRQDAYFLLDGLYARTEAVLDAWDIAEERLDADAEEPEDEHTGDGDAPAAGVAAAVGGQEEAARQIQDVFTPREIRDMRLDVRQNPTTTATYRLRRTLLVYWHEQLLHEYKTLDVKGDDTIHVEYLDAYGETEDNVVRVDQIGIASDATIVCVGPDMESPVQAAIMGDEIRVRVTDPDRSVSDGIDTVDVVVATIPRIVTEAQDDADDEPDANRERAEAGTSVDVFADTGDTEFEMPPLVPEGAPSARLTLHETGPHTGVFVGAIPTLIGDPEHPFAALSIGPDRLVRIAYRDMLTASFPGEWVVATQVEVVPSTGGEHEVIELQETQLDRRSELEKAIAMGNLGRVYQDIGLRLEAHRTFDEAIRIVRRIVDAERGSAMGEEATYQMWDLYFASGDEEAAARACARLLAEFPNSPLAPDALLIMAKTAENRAGDRGHHYHEAMRHYNSLVQRYPDSPAAPEALFRMAVMRADRERFDVGAFEAVAARYPDTNYAAQSLLRLGAHYIEQRDYRRARDYLERVALDFPDFDGLDQVTFLRGICAYRSGEIEAAYTLMHETIERYPGTAAARSAGQIVDVLRTRLQR